jgi:hypothetical protein
MTASFPEIFQVLVALIGNIFAREELTEANKDKDSVESHEQPRKDDIDTANKNVRIARVIWAVQALFFVAGLYTVFSPPPPFLPFEGLTDVQGRITDAQIELIIWGNRMSIYTKIIVMTFGSGVLAWLSYMNKAKMTHVRRQRRDDGNGNGNGNGNGHASIGDGDQKYKMEGTVSLEKKETPHDPA